MARIFVGSGYKRDLSDKSHLDRCLYRSKHGYIVAAVQSRMDDVVIPYVEPAHGPFKYISDARLCYQNPPAESTIVHPKPKPVPFTKTPPNFVEDTDEWDS